jgi:hypothetical protein
MGTNYYLRMSEKDYKATRKHQHIAKTIEEEFKLLSLPAFTSPKTYDDFYYIHLGKSSVGWYFCVRTYPDNGIEFLEDWVKFFQILRQKNTHFEIVSEYMTPLSVEEFLQIVINREGSEDPFSDKFLKENRARVGLYNLLVDKDMETGIGPWCYKDREFF